MKYSDYQKLLEKDSSSAQHTLFREYINYVYTIAFNRLRSCGSHEDIEECVMDIFSDVFASYEYQPDTPGDIKGFIGTVALRKSTAYYHKLCKKQGSISLDDDNVPDVPSEEDVSETAEANETKRLLLKLIEDLGEPDATIIIQKYYYGRSSREISGMVSMSPSMVRVRSGRALKKLRKLLSENGITD